MPGNVCILNKYKKECKTFVYLVLNDTFWYFLNDFIFHHIDASIPLSFLSHFKLADGRVFERSRLSTQEQANKP